MGQFTLRNTTGKPLIVVEQIATSAGGCKRHLSPARVRFTRTLNSTRWFCERPVEVSLEATGAAVPIRAGCYDAPTATLQFWIKKATTSCTRSMLSRWFMDAFPVESAYPFTSMRLSPGRPTINPGSLSLQHCRDSERSLRTSKPASWQCRSSR